ncbi:MAG: RcnB family protein [Pseudomonadota bacterium]
MKIYALIFAAIAACASAGVSAAGNPYDYRGDRYERGYHDYRGHHRHHYWRHHRPHYRHHHYRGAGPYDDLWYDDRLPAHYWGPRVIDWQRTRLGPPMYGCHWVRVGNDYVQVSAATGMITAVLLRP